MSRQSIGTVVTLVALATLTGCAQTPVAERTAAGTRAVAIRFGLRAGQASLACDEPAVPLGRGQQPARLHDARWYAYELALLAADGTRVPVTLDANEWQHEGIALVDLESARSPESLCAKGTAGLHEAVTGAVPAGRYAGLSFRIGVPGQINHSSTTQAPPPLDIAAMSWVWQAGRRFMKLEFDPEGGVARKGSSARTWMLHLGSTGCEGDPMKGETVTCTAGNRFEVRLPRFDVARDIVVLDVAALVRRIDLGRDDGFAVGCMSHPDDPECGPVFEAFGLGSGAGGGGTARDDVFRAERR